MNLLHIFLLVEIILLVYLGISYTMYVYTRYLVSENYPTGEDTSKYKIIVKRYRFWESNTLSTNFTFGIDFYRLRYFSFSTLILTVR